MSAPAAAPGRGRRGCARRPAVRRQAAAPAPLARVALLVPAAALLGALGGGGLAARSTAAFAPPPAAADAGPPEALAAPPEVAGARLPRRASLGGLGAALSLPGAARALESARPKPGARVDVWEVQYPDGPPTDIYFGGGKAQTYVQNQFNARVLEVMPGGPSEAAGVRPNDEVSLLLGKGNTARFKNILMTEEGLRTMKDVNRDIPRKLARGGSIVFRAKSGLQVGDMVPDFSLPSIRGFNISLSQILGSGAPVVIFFHPGGRFYGGDREELKYFAKAGPIFKDLGVNLVGITTDIAPVQLRLGQTYATQFPLLTDATGDAAKIFGAKVIVGEFDVCTDRKTFIVGADGRLKKAFLDVGWEVNKEQAAAHVAEVAGVFGANEDAVVEALLPKQKTVGEVIEIASGRVPKKRVGELPVNEAPIVLPDIGKAVENRFGGQSAIGSLGGALALSK